MAKRFAEIVGEISVSEFNDFLLSKMPELLDAADIKLCWGCGEPMVQREKPKRTSLAYETHYCGHQQGEEYIWYSNGQLWYTPPRGNKVNVLGYKIADENNPDWVRSEYSPPKHPKLRLQYV